MGGMEPLVELDLGDLRLRTLTLEDEDAALLVEATRAESARALWGPRPAGPYSLVAQRRPRAGYLARLPDLDPHRLTGRDSQASSGTSSRAPHELDVRFHAAARMSSRHSGRSEPVEARERRGQQHERELRSEPWSQRTAGRR
jgi:hypothetical protein